MSSQSSADGGSFPQGNIWSVSQLSDVYPPPHLGQVNEAEEERLRGEREHQRVTRLCQQAEARVQALQKTLRRAIGKSRPYFELKAQFSQILEVAEGGTAGGHGEGGERDTGLLPQPGSVWWDGPHRSANWDRGGCWQRMELRGGEQEKK